MFRAQFYGSVGRFEESWGESFGKSLKGHTWLQREFRIREQDFRKYFPIKLVKMNTVRRDPCKTSAPGNRSGNSGLQPTGPNASWNKIFGGSCKQQGIHPMDLLWWTHSRMITSTLPRLPPLSSSGSFRPLFFIRISRSSWCAQSATTPSHEFARNTRNMTQSDRKMMKLSNAIQNNK